MNNALSTAGSGRILRGQWIKELAIPILSVSVFVIILLNYFPVLFRPLSLHLRTGFNLQVALIFFLLYLSFRLSGWSGRLLACSLTLVVFALALAGLWATGQTQPTIFSGVIPLYDAQDYYSDALRLISGQDFSSVSARRPLYPGMLAVMLWATQHNLMATLGIFTLVTALACYMTARIIQRIYGAEIAIFVLFLLFLFYRYHSGAVMSENLGFPLGVIGFALLLQSPQNRDHFYLWMGLFITTLALNARAGTFFMLPALLLWGGRVFRTPNSKFSIRFLVLGTTAILAAFAVNILMVRLLARPSGVPFANFSYSLYGLASGGKSWNYVFATHPELSFLEEPYQSREIYRMAISLIKQDPGLLVRGMFYNWRMFFSISGYGAYSFVGGENISVSVIAQSSMFFLCALGFIRCLVRRDDVVSGLVGMAALGVLLSVPFLPPTDASRVRPYAASIIIFNLLPAMGLVLGIENMKLHFLDKLQPDNGRQSMIFSIGLVFFMTIGPAFIKSIGRIPQFDSSVCDSNLDFISVRFDASAHISILRQNAPGLDRVPLIHIGRFRRNSHSLPDSNMIAWAETIEPGNSLFSTFDYATMDSILVITHTNLLPEPGTLWQVCGEWEMEENLSRYHIFYVRTEADGSR